MSKSVYIVTQGSYSEFHIDSVYRTKNEANKRVDQLGGDEKEADVEEWPFEHLQESIEYLVQVKEDGSILHWMLGSRNRTDWFFREFPNKETVLSAHVSANDPQHAIKIANERRTYYVAQGWWPSDERMAKAKANRSYPTIEEIKAEIAEQLHE